MKFISVGYTNVVNADRIVTVVAANSAPAKRMVQEAKDVSRCIDATSGRKTKSVIIMDSDHVVLSALQVNTIKQRLISEDDRDIEEEDDE